MVSIIEVPIDELKDNKLWYRFDVEINSMIKELERQVVNPENIIIIGRKLNDGSIRIIDGHVRRLFFKKQLLNGDKRFNKIKVNILDIDTDEEELKEHAVRYNVTKRTIFESDLMFYRFLNNDTSPFFSNKKLFKEFFKFSDSEVTSLMKSVPYRKEYIKKFGIKTVNDAILNISRQVMYKIVSKREKLTDEVIEEIIKNWNRNWNNNTTLYEELLNPLINMNSIKERINFIKNNGGSGKVSQSDFILNDKEHIMYAKFIVSGITKQVKFTKQLYNDMKKLNEICEKKEDIFDDVAIRQDDLLSEIKNNIDCFTTEYNKFIDKHCNNEDIKDLYNNELSPIYDGYLSDDNINREFKNKK